MQAQYYFPGPVASGPGASELVSRRPPLLTHTLRPVRMPGHGQAGGASRAAVAVHTATRRHAHASPRTGSVILICAQLAVQVNMLPARLSHRFRLKLITLARAADPLEGKEAVVGCSCRNLSIQRRLHKVIA